MERTPDMPKKPILHSDHPRPLTRRQFLAAGLIPAGGFLMMPSLLSRFFSPKMYEAVAGQPDMGLLFVNIAGGNQLTHHVIPNGPGGALANGTIDASIPQAGLDTLAVTAATPDFALGLPLNPASGFTQALLGMLSPAALAATRGAVFNVISQDDSSSVALGFADWAAAAHNQIYGNALLPALGVKASSTGFNMTNASGASVNPLVVSNVGALSGAVGLGGLYGQLGFSTAAQQAMLNGPAAVSAPFASALGKFLRGTDYSNLVQASEAKNKGLLGTPPNVLASTDTTVAPLWNGASFPATSVAASIAYNVAAGQAAVAGVEQTGGDYHGTGPQNFLNQHLQTAELVAHSLNTAAALGRNLMVAVVTDGATACNLSGTGTATITKFDGTTLTVNSTGQATGDDGTRSMAMVFCLKSGASNGSQYVNGASTMVTVGSRLASGAVSSSTPAPNGAPNISGSPQKIAAAIFANWLNAQGQFSLYSNIAGGVLPAAVAQQYLIFQ